MNSFNLTAVGNLANDPELAVKGDTTYTKFCMVGNDYAGKDEQGNAREIVTTLWFVAFDGLGEAIAKNVRKGDQLIVEARVRSNNWTLQRGGTALRPFVHRAVLPVRRAGQGETRGTGETCGTRARRDGDRDLANRHSRPERIFAMHHPHRRQARRVPMSLPVLIVALAMCVPELCLAQASPFMTGASALQTNILAWLTPIAIILIMVLGGMAMANRMSWGWCLGAILGIAIAFGAPQIVTWVRGMFGV